MASFATWLENNAQAQYKKLGGEIFDYISELFTHLEGNLTGEEAFKRTLHAFSDDILSLEPTMQRPMVQAVKRLCDKFGQDASFSLGMTGPEGDQEVQ